MSTWLAAGGALLAACLWGYGSFLFQRLLRAPGGPSAAGMNLFKNTTALVVFLCVWAIVGGELGSDRGNLAGLLWSGVLGFALGDTFFIAALPRCGVQATSMVAQINVPLSALLAWIALGEKLSAWALVSMGLVLLGVVLVIRDPVAREHQSSNGRTPKAFWQGVVLAILCACVLASGNVLGHSSFAGIGLIPAIEIRLLGGVLGVLGAALVVGLFKRSVGREVAQTVRPLVQRKLWKQLMYATFFATLLISLPFHYALRELDAGISAVLFATTPLFTLPMGIVFGERHGPQGWIGTIIGFVGVVGVLLSATTSTGPAAPVVDSAFAPVPGLWPDLISFDGSVEMVSTHPDRDGLSFGLAGLEAALTQWSRMPVQGELFVNWADYPTIASNGSSSSLVTWLEKSGDGTFAYHVKYATPVGSRGQWSLPQTLHDDRSDTEHGFVSITMRPDGHYSAVWLDGRHTSGGHGGVGAMTLMTRTVSPGGELGTEVLLDERICDCCSTDAVCLDDGTVVFAYRDRSLDEVRDISIVRGTGESWSDPISVHADNWRVAGCPVNGPALASEGQRVSAAWFTLGSDDTPRVLLASSTDGGRTFAAPVQVDGGEAIGRVDLVALTDGRSLVSWLEMSGEAAEWRARIVTPDGVLGDSAVIGAAKGDRSDGFLRLAEATGGVVAVWCDGEAGEIHSAFLSGLD